MLQRGVRWALVLLACGLVLHPAQAQEHEPQDLPEYELDEVTVTTTRYETERDLVPRRLEVIGPAELAATPADDLVDVLKKQAAVDVIQYPNLLAGIGIRGFRPQFSGLNQRTLLLLDGRPAGAGNLATFNLAGIERVEVLKGPGAALYGSSAMGGVVNLITRQSQGALGGRLTAAYGSFETVELDARLGGGLTEAVDFDLGFALFERGEDFRLGSGNYLRDAVGDEEAMQILADGTEQAVDDVFDDGETRPNTQMSYLSGSARLGVQATERLRADLRGEFFSARNVETPGDLAPGSFSGPGLKNVFRNTADLSLTGQFGRHQPLVRLYVAEAETELFEIDVEDPFVDFASDDQTLGFQVQDAVALGPHTLTVGVDGSTVDETAESFELNADSSAVVQIAPFSPDAATTSLAAFAAGNVKLLEERFVGTLGARLDRITLALEETPLRPDVEAEEEAFLTLNPNVGAQYTFASGLRPHASLGRAFLAPGASTRAGRSFRVSSSTGTAGAFIGNPELDPESAWTFDAGLAFSRPRLGLDADVTFFQTWVTDRITSLQFTPEFTLAAPAGAPISQITTYVNASEAEMRGLEYRLSYDVGALSGFRYSLRVFANVTHLLRAEETTQAVTVDPARLDPAEALTPDALLAAAQFGEETTSDIKNVADVTVTFGVEYDDLRRFRTRLGGRYVGERLDTDFAAPLPYPDVQYPAFMVLDLSTTFRLRDGFEAGLEISNLTDENYYEKRGYNLEGRAFRLQLTADL